VARLVLILPTATYRASEFLAAAAKLGVDVVVATEHPQPLAASMEDSAVVVDLDRPEDAAVAIEALARRHQVDAVVGVDDGGVLIAAHTAELLGLAHNPPDAVAATRDKAVQRAVLDAWDVPQPAFRVALPGADVGALAREVGLPCVVKPVSLSASTGVIRADTPAEASAAEQRVRRILAHHDHDPDEALLVEQFVAGSEVALEGLLQDGRLEVLAVFDKPDPLDGPYFAETLYVTPSRLPQTAQDQVVAAVTAACRALGLREGPVHAEARVDVAGAPPVHVLEVAARSIGGLCSRALRFGAGISLEEVIVRHALGLGAGDLHRADAASGVLMLPTERTGVLREVAGVEEAAAVPGVAGFEITVARGRPVEALPEGGRYLGFVFARASTPAAVEDALRQAQDALQIVIDEGDGAISPSPRRIEPRAVAVKVDPRRVAPSDR
jgi:biotin carboxylase